MVFVSLCAACSSIVEGHSTAPTAIVFVYGDWYFTATLRYFLYQLLLNDQTATSFSSTQGLNPLT